VPANVHIEGELRSFELAEARQRYMQAIQQAFEEAAQKLGGSVKITFEPHCTSYVVDEYEPLLQLYREVLANRNQQLLLRPTFIGSDAGAFRPHVKTFTISTGVVNEHSAEEYVPLEPLGVVVEDVLQVLELYRAL
jgi:tripeptide aminopeptidase